MIGSLRVVVAALRNRRIRSILVAFLLFGVAEWARWVALLVYGFERSGPAGAGLIAVIQLVPAALLTPFTSSLADRFHRARVLLAAYLVAGLGTAGSGLAMALDAPFLLVALLSAGALCGITLVRPTQASFLPQLVATPAELTAANATSSFITGSSVLAGPAVAAAVLAVAGTGAAMVVAGASLLLGAASIGFVHRASPHTVGSSAPVELLGGFRMLGRERGAASIIVLLGLQATVWGAVDVLIVSLAIRELGLGGSGAGLLTAAVGVGGVVGGAATVSLVGRPRLTSALALGVCLWSLPLIAIAAVLTPLPVVLLLAIAGAGFAFLDVAGRTLLQRVVDDDALGRVFGVLESGFMAAWALGSAAAPLMLGVLPIHLAFAGAGLVVPLAAVAGWRRLSKVDAGAGVPAGWLEVFRRTDIFAPLSVTALERLLRSVVTVDVSTGTTFIRQGDPGDRFYAIAEGEARVTKDGADVERVGAGDYVGEIALLRDVPRQASVTALTDLRLLALDREPFLAAVTGSRGAAAAAEGEVDRRLANLPSNEGASRGPTA